METPFGQKRKPHLRSDENDDAGPVNFYEKPKVALTTFVLINNGVLGIDGCTDRDQVADMIKRIFVGIDPVLTPAFS